MFVSDLASLKRAGPVQLESKPEEGTIVTLRMHRHASSSPDPKQTRLESAGDIKGQPLVVLVDDEASVRDGMAQLLTDWGCEVISASCGTDAVGKIRLTDKRPALLIVDNRLDNEEKGLDVIERCRDTANHGTHAVLMTGDISNIEGLDDRIDVTLLKKPVAPSELRQHINQSMG